MKYAQKLQTRTITKEELNIMEDEIIYYQPI